jgi:hypothetical protein
MTRLLFAGTLALVAVLSGFAGAHAGTIEVVFCAPGYPGTTGQAVPTMADFARVLAVEAGVDPSGLGAVYHETEAGCVAALGDSDPQIVLTTLPFWLAHREGSGLRPVLLAVPPSGAGESWTLVAKRGRVAVPADLDGFMVESIAGFAPAFVRGPALAEWGALPGSATVAFTARVLSSLRNAARGEDVAVLLDGAQAAGLDRLPFASDLEVVARSPEVPSYLVCDRGQGTTTADVRAALDALIRLHESDDGRTVLGEIRLERFAALPEGVLEFATHAFDRAVAAP